MKKSVRIRKALPGETPGYYNKTAKFLKKAQMGMSVGSPSMDPARLNQIYESVYSALKNDTPADMIYGSLTGEYALDQNTSLSIIKAALNKLSEEGFIDPSLIEDQQQQGQQNQEQPDNSQAAADEEQQRMSEDAENEELAMSDDGYYDEEEAQMNDNTHLDTEEDEQEQAFRYGGYFQNGGEEEFVDAETVQDTDPKKAIMNQYDSAGNPKDNKPFSMEDLMAVTPGMQGQEAFPDLSYYLGDYRPVGDSWDAQDFLPTAQKGGYLPKAQNAGQVSGFLQKTYPLLKGFNYPRTITPMTNLSQMRSLVPAMTMVGQGMTKLPLIGSKLAPKLATTFTQNRAELWNILNGASPKTGVFSGSLNLGDGTLQADRLLLYQDDVQKIIQGLENAQGEGAFSLKDINPIAQQDGLVSGVYPMDAKVIGGTDDLGNKFFEIKHTFGPNQQLPFGTTPAKAKEFTVKNRFYYNTDPETGALSVFDPLGNPLSTGTRSVSQVTRPVASRYARGIGDFALRSGLTPFPSYGGGFTGLTETTAIPPTTWNDLSFRGKVGRGLETYATTGLNQFFRTGQSGIKNLELPVFGFSNSALGPNVINPVNETAQQTASDIKNAINYKYRLGLKSTLIGGGLGYLGYKTYDAFANPCQCVDPKAPNYMKLDAFGKCPCGTDVGPIRTLDPTGTPIETPLPADSLMAPDSMRFLMERGIYPSEYNYYRFNEGNINPNTQNQTLPDDFKKGGAFRKKFVNKLASMFQEGGPAESAELGKGKRNDTLTNDVENRKGMFTSKLKNNSNKAISEEIYKNAQHNPKIMNMLMQDGFKENLADDTQMPEAQYGLSMGDNMVPSWYRGYKGMLAPRQYKKMYKQMKRMMPKGLDISRANMASNFYHKNYMQPPFGYSATLPEYFNMMAGYAAPMVLASGSMPMAGAIDPNYRPSAQQQANEAIEKNNLNGIPMLPELSPDFIDSPLMPTENFNMMDLPIIPMAEEGGFVDMDSDNPLVRFVYGGNEAEYYEPDTLPMAQNGINIMNYLKEHRTVADKLGFDEWIAGEEEDWKAANPDKDVEAWKKDDARKEDYKKYEDFYSQSLYDYMNVGKDQIQDQSSTGNQGTNGNCPPGYTWDGTKCVANQGTTTQTKCGPGTVWNATYKACIPVASINYKPRVVRPQTTLSNTLLPWNAPFGYAGSWTKQMSLPYNLATKQAYMGQLPGAPAARYVTKKGMFGQPKKWIDIYQTSGQPGMINPMELEALVKGTKAKSDKPERDRNRPEREERVSKTERIDQELLKDEWNKKNWDRLSDRDKRIARRTFAFDNPEFRRFSDKVVFKQGQPGQGFYYESNKTKRVKDKKEYGGYMQMGGYNPFEAGTGFGMGMGQNNSGYGQYSPDQQFQNELFGTDRPSAAPPQQQNPFAFITGTGTGSYAETANTGHTLGNQGQEIIPQKEPAPADTQNQFIGVENKRKNMWNIDPEAGVNVFNAGARGVMGMFDRMQNKKRERELMLNTVDPMNLYASANEQDRGDWQDFGSKSGMYRYDQQGQDRSSRATYGNYATTQYGGFMQQGGFADDYFEEDEEVYMTPEELEQFLAAGGQVEYL